MLWGSQSTHNGALGHGCSELQPACNSALKDGKNPCLALLKELLHRSLHCLLIKSKNLLKSVLCCAVVAGGTHWDGWTEVGLVKYTANQ